MSNEMIVSENRGIAAAPASIFSLAPAQMVARATEMANVLSDIVEKQRLYTVIQGKKYLIVDAWATLGTLLGVMPKERHVIEHPSGDFEAFVDLVSQATGHVIGGASALCSVQESRWGKAERYARRSMAITRATGKAYRLSFAWIAALKGYESTPSEEMPHDEAPREKDARPAQRQPAAKKDDGERFDPKNDAHVERLRKAFDHLKIEGEDLRDKVAHRLIGCPMTTGEIQKAVVDLELPF